MAEPDFNRVFLSLGSNINPEQNLHFAVKKIAESGRILAASSVWKTLPVGFLDQDSFLNASILFESELSAWEICKELIPQVEDELNRVRDPENKNGPRTIDIDLTLFNSEILQIEHRQIPDPELLTRGFIAVPVAELDPDYIHPVTLQDLGAIASGFDPDKLGMILMKEINLTELIN
jgi:2-amino-4-hydroxy-6-hydroxymethyldihydropteridine diphosphokinase